MFVGKHKGKFNTEEMKFQENDASLRSILIPGELNPNEWVKFRFIFLELWHSKNTDLNSIIVKELNDSRILLYKTYCKRTISEHCKINNIEEENIPDSTKKAMFRKCKAILVGEINALEVSRTITDDSIFDVWERKAI